MANAEKFEAKLKALRDKLQTYGHVPSVAEDRAINANVKYYYKNYANHPLVIKLMNDFPLNIGERGSYKKHPDFESRVLSIEEQLVKLGRVPTSDEDKSLLAEINYCYRIYKNNKEIKRLSKLYPTNTLYSKWGPRGNKDSFSKSFCIGGPDSHGMLKIGPITYFEDPFLRAKRYILECVEEYNELPGINTWPMHFVLEKLDNNYRNGISSEIVDFIGMLIQKDCVRDEVKNIYYSSLLDRHPLFARIMSIMEKRKICSIGYLSKNIMPGVKISCKKLYQFFYYIDQNNGYLSRGIEKSHRHLFRMFDYETDYAGRIVSLPLDNLVHLDYREIASNQSLRILPSYSIDFTEEEESQYANAFLFHINTEYDYITHQFVRTIDYSKTLIDDIRGGKCPFRFLDKYPFYDAPDKTIEWCNQLVDLNSILLGVYIKNGKFFQSFRSIINDVTSSCSHEKVKKLLTYLKDTYNFTIL